MRRRLYDRSGTTPPLTLECGTFGHNDHRRIQSSAGANHPGQDAPTVGFKTVLVLAPARRGRVLVWLQISGRDHVLFDTIQCIDDPGQRPGPSSQAAPRPGLAVGGPAGESAGGVMESKEHWDNIYATRAATELSWFQAHAALSLQLIRDNGVPKSGAIIDVGGGASTLVDDLLATGFEHLTVLDLSGVAIATAKARLGSRADHVKWLQADILDLELPPQGYDVWHDRAVFHFITAATERRAYVSSALQAVKPGGLVIVATFAEDGPAQCSGLPVMRYGANALHAEFGEAFQLLGQERESHHTPGGNEQKFVYCVLRKVGA